MLSVAVSGFSHTCKTDHVSEKTWFYLFARKGKHVSLITFSSIILFYRCDFHNERINEYVVQLYLFVQNNFLKEKTKKN